MNKTPRCYYCGKEIKENDRFMEYAGFYRCYDCVKKMIEEMEW